MEKRNLEIEVNESEFQLLLDAIKYQIESTTDQALKDQLADIHERISKDTDLQSRVTGAVIKMLRGYTNVRPIKPQSDLDFGLSISVGFIKNHLYKPCNSIAQGINPNAKKIRRAEAAECESVQDIIDLIISKI